MFPQFNLCKYHIILGFIPVKRQEGGIFETYDGMYKEDIYFGGVYAYF